MGSLEGGSGHRSFAAECRHLALFVRTKTHVFSSQIVSSSVQIDEVLAVHSLFALTDSPSVTKSSARRLNPRLFQPHPRSAARSTSYQIIQGRVVQLPMNNAEYPQLNRKNAVLGPEIILVRGLLKLVPAVAYHFCLNLPATFLQPGAYSFGDPCTLLTCPVRMSALQ